MLCIEHDFHISGAIHSLCLNAISYWSVAKILFLGGVIYTLSKVRAFDFGSFCCIK
jgi:hypothetical protein